MSLFKKMMLLLVPVALLTAGCNSDEDDVDPTEGNETITTATLSLTNAAIPTEVVTATIDNLGGAGAVSKTTLTLKPNTTYTGALLLLDKTKTPTLDVSAEVKAEANEHLVIYTPGTGLTLTVTATDRDTNPTRYPIGLATEVKTGAASTGSLKVVLKHQPNAKNGTATPGTTDLETDFDVVIR